MRPRNKSIVSLPLFFQKNGVIQPYLAAVQSSTCTMYTSLIYSSRAFKIIPLSIHFPIVAYSKYVWITALRNLILGISMQYSKFRNKLLSFHDRKIAITQNNEREPYFIQRTDIWTWLSLWSIHNKQDSTVVCWFT